MVSFRVAFLTFAALSLAACASVSLSPPASPQETPAQLHPSTVSVTAGLTRYLDQRARVERVGFRLRRAAAETCSKRGQTKPDVGVIVWSLANFPNGDDRAYLQQKFALTDAVTVALAVEGAPGEKAGLRAGAIVTHVNDDAVLEGKGATERFIALSNAAAKDGPVRLRLADKRTLAIKPQPVCEFPTLLVRSAEVNAAADGRVLAITTGLFELTRSDDELALILGHELSHNVLGHLEQLAAKNKPGILDAFVRATIGTAVASTVNQPFSPENEREADYVGLYLMARAGFDIDAADAFWRRLNEMTKANAVATTHPSGPDRLKAIKATIAEIKAKQKAKQPLDPDPR